MSHCALRRAIVAGLAIGTLLLPTTVGRSQARSDQAASSTLVIGYDSFPTDLNPFTEPDEASWQVLEMTAGFLVDISPKTLQPMPAVAKSWTITSAGKVYTFHIRPGVRFSDGNPLTAADVAWTMTNYANPKISPVVASFYNQMVSATAVDPLTLRVTLKQPSAPFLANAAQMFILEKKVFEHLKINKANWGTNYTQWPIGPGPWMIKEVVPNDHITFAPNPYYWGGKAKIQTLIWKTVPDDNTLFAQLQTGEVQATPLLSKFSRVLDTSKFAAYSSSSLQWYSVWLNFRRPFFADRQVRQAMMYAIDRAGMVKAVYSGGADIMNAEIPPAVGGLYNANVPNKYPYDPAKAKSLLAAAGWKPGSDGTLTKGGVKFSFNLLFVRGDSQGEQMATIIQQNLASVGISVQIQGLDYSVLNNSRLTTGNFDAVVNSYYNYAFPDNVFQFGCKETPADSGTNYGSYCNTTVDKLLQQADASIDPAAQKRVFATLQETMNQDLPYLWLLSPRSSWAMAKTVTGYIANPVDSDIWQAWQWSSTATAGY